MSEPSNPRNVSNPSNPSDTFYWKDWETSEVTSCSLAAQGLWMRMLCLAARATPRGYVKVGTKQCTAEDLARIVGESKETAQTLLDELASKGVFDRTRDQTIFNRRMVKREKQRKASAKGGKIGGKASYENKRGIFSTPEDTPGGTPETAPLPFTLTPIPNKKEPPNPQAGSDDPLREFEEWYRVYPRKTGKGDAERKYRSARSKGVTAELLLRAAQAFARLKAGSDPKFIPHPATWLHQTRWLDEELRLQPEAQPGAEPATAAAAALVLSDSDDSETLRWKVRLKGWREKGQWMANHWGPPPGQPGCRVPPELLGEET